MILLVIIVYSQVFVSWCVGINSLVFVVYKKLLLKFENTN